MLGDYAQNFLAQNRNEPRMTGRGPLVREQNLQALARGGAAPFGQKAETDSCRPPAEQPVK